MFTILQIDDLDSMHQLMRAIFANRTGTRLLCVDNGSEGIALAKSEKPDLVLLDVNMPEMAGPEVLARLKCDPSTAGIPVIVITGSAEKDVVNSMLVNGAMFHLPKPFKLHSLFTLVDSIEASAERQIAVAG